MHRNVRLRCIWRYVETFKKDSYRLWNDQKLPFLKLQPSTTPLKQVSAQVGRIILWIYLKCPIHLLRYRCVIIYPKIWNLIQKLIAGWWLAKKRENWKIISEKLQSAFRDGTIATKKYLQSCHYDCTLNARYTILNNRPHSQTELNITGKLKSISRSFHGQNCKLTEHKGQIM